MTPVRAHVAADLLASRARTDSLEKSLLVSRLSLDFASSEAASMRARAEAAESHLRRASFSNAEAAAGMYGLHPLILSALNHAGLQASVLSYAEHIGPVQRLHGSNLEGQLCVVAKPNAQAVPVLLAHAFRLSQTKTRESYTFHSAAQYLPGLVVSDRHNLRVARRGVSKSDVPAGVGSSSLVLDASLRWYKPYRPDFRVACARRQSLPRLRSLLLLAWFELACPKAKLRLCAILLTYQ